jgi:hypothetical protein
MPMETLEDGKKIWQEKKLSQASPDSRLRRIGNCQIGSEFLHALGTAMGADKIAGRDLEQPQACPKGGVQDARSNPRRLQLNATNCSAWQLSQRTRRKPC